MLDLDLWCWVLWFDELGVAGHGPHVLCLNLLTDDMIQLAEAGRAHAAAAEETSFRQTWHAFFDTAYHGAGQAHRLTKEVVDTQVQLALARGWRISLDQ